MARPIWKGHISFGLVNIPVVLEPAERRADLHFRLLDSRDQARIRYERVNEETGEEVPWNEIVRGYEYAGGNYVLLTDEDFERVAVEASKTVEIEDFIDAADIDLRYFDKPYYLTPDRRGEKGYVLLRETLRQTGKAAVAKVVIRKRQYIAAVTPHAEALVLMLLRFKQEVRPLQELELPREDLKAYKISPKEMEMAQQLVESMSGDWNPEKYHDEYRDALLEWIEKKAKSGQRTARPPAGQEEEEAPQEVVNIMDLLKKSVAQQGKRGEKQEQGGKKKMKKRAPKTRKKRKGA